MREKPIAESPERWRTGRLGSATAAAIAWPRPTPIVPYVPALRQERALATFNCVSPISIVPAPSALKIAFFGTHAAAQAGVALAEPVLGRAYGPTPGPTKATPGRLFGPVSSGAASTLTTFLSLA